MTEEKAYVLAITTSDDKDEVSREVVTFPSRNMWMGVHWNYAIELTEKQIDDLHEKIHKFKEDHR
jgi:hypothetical protein